MFMEKFNEQSGYRTELFTQIPQELVRYFKADSNTDSIKMETLIFDLDEGYISNFHILDKSFGKHLNNVIFDSSIGGAIEGDGVEVDRKRQGVQKFIFESWKESKKEKIEQFLEYVGFKSFKTTMYYFQTSNSTGIAIHRDKWSLDDPKGISRIFFGNSLDIAVLISNLTKKNIIREASENLLNDAGAYEYYKGNANGSD